MKKCTNCGHIQEDGKFCGKCGSVLQPEAAELQAANPEGQQVKTESQTEAAGSAKNNEVLVKVKDESLQYTSYFMEQLKQPSKQFFQAGGYFKHAVTSIAIYIVLFSLFIWTLLTKMGYESDYGLIQLPSKSSIIFRIDLCLLMALAIGVLAAFVTIKMFGPEAGWKTIISQYASFIGVPMISLLLAIFAILIEWQAGFLIFTILSLLVVMLVIPMYVVVLTLTKHSKTVDRFYAYLLSMTIIMAANYIFYLILLDSMLSNIFY